MNATFAQLKVVGRFPMEGVTTLAAEASTEIASPVPTEPVDNTGPKVNRPIE